MKDSEITSQFDNLNTKFDSLNIEMQNNNIIGKKLQDSITHMTSDVAEIKTNILQNCKKLDTLESKIDQLISKTNHLT